VRAHRELREAIVSGRLRPNERLVETELAERLDVSRTPLREGLLRLAAEGLITSSRLGWIVREHTPDEVRQIYEVRGALEGLAVSLAAQRASDEQLERIGEIHAGGGPHLVEHPRTVLVEVNDAFHEAIVEAADNERLHELLGQNRRFFFNHRLAEQFTEEEARASLAGHAEIVDALSARNAERGERAMREHIRQAMELTLGKLR
jgi:DNA-binding GntR family transcriptional regulator